MQLAVPPSVPAADLRSAEILDGVRRAFAENGFDGASMQDLARAAGMSVGNFYRYFPSKAAIVEAFVTRDLEEIDREFELVIQAPRPMEALRAGLHRRITEHGCDGSVGQLWAEMAAASLRKSEIGAIVGRMEGSIVQKMACVFSMATGLSAPETQARFSAHAMLVIMLVKAAAMKSPAACALDSDLNALVLRSIDRILDEVAAAGMPGGTTAKD